MQHTHAVVRCHMRHAAISLHHGRIDAHADIGIVLGPRRSRATDTILLWVVHHLLRLLLLLVLRRRRLRLLALEVVRNRNRLCGRGDIGVEGGLLLLLLLLLLELEL